MLTLQAKVKFQNEEDEQIVLDLMRRWSSCMRYSYNRLIDGFGRKTLKRELQSVFNLNSRYVDDAILKANLNLKIIKSLDGNPKKVIFGGRDLFEKLKKKHINGKPYEKLKIEWLERRKCNLFSRGDKSKKGNLNTRIEEIDKNYFLRINVGERQYVYANISYGFDNDRFMKYLPILLSGEAPYSIELKKKNNQYYAFISVEEEIPKVTITKDNGVIGIDLNAYPSHIAWAEVDKVGNLLTYGTIPMPELESGSTSKREYFRWQYAHKVVEIAKEKGKAIVIEKLNIDNKGNKGDYSGRKSRRIRHNFSYRTMIDKIKVEALRNGIEVIEVNPSYTSVIGMLKYSPQYMLTKDISASYVIARRGLGKKERLPKNYVKLLQSLTSEELTNLKKELSKTIKNKYIKSKRLRELNTLIQSLESKPWRLSRPLEGTSLGNHYPWQVLKVAVVTPLSPEKSPRDFSTLKKLLIQGKWGDLQRRKLLLLGAGTMDTQIPPAGEGYPEMAVTNTPAPKLYKKV